MQDLQGLLPVDDSALPQGASMIADPKQSRLTGHYHRLPAGMILPRGLAVIADGCDVVADSLLPPGHYTLHITEPMTALEFIEKFAGLPWAYGGRQ